MIKGLGKENLTEKYLKKKFFWDYSWDNKWVTS